MWQAIQYVTTGFTLAAFIAAAIASVLKRQADNKLKAIQSAPEEDRPDLVRDALEFLHVEPSGLTKEQQYDIAVKQIQERATRFRITATVVVLLALIGASLSAFAISHAAGQATDVKPEAKNREVTQPPPSQTWHTEDKDGRPYQAHWQFAPNCGGKYGLMRVDDTHRCDIEPTQIHVNGDPTGYDTWNLWMDAPQGALVHEVGCEPTGEHEIQPRGIAQGQTGLCTGLINGGAADIRMYIKWRQLW